MILGHHIFASSLSDEVAICFAEKISLFHESYIDSLLIHEVGLNGNFSKNPDFDPLFYSLLIKNLQKSSPWIRVDHVSDKSIDVACAIYYLSDDEEVEGFYMTQIVSNWDNTNKFCYQVWNLKTDCNLLKLNNHWF
tara:strand:- start:1390 stop:1797 length:408 start_codon:yes stop_codon:yes gene_type:complete